MPLCPVHVLSGLCLRISFIKESDWGHDVSYESWKVKQAPDGTIPADVKSYNCGYNVDVWTLFRWPLIPWV